MAGLRERRHRETKELLVDVAFGLFAERGYGNVTMEEVAHAAGVSRSTVYRRFATKDDIVLEVPRRWLGAFDAAVADLDDGASLTTAVTAATLAVARHIDEHHVTARAAYSILDTAPSLQQAGVATTAWLERFVRLLQARVGPSDGTTAGIDDETARIVAGAYLGAIDAMMQYWAMMGGTASVAESSQRLLDRLEPILPFTAGAAHSLRAR
ncbi:MAG: helix-turn-helix domain-containing protein [Acidimicrobiales bacterium]